MARVSNNLRRTLIPASTPSLPTPLFREELCCPNRLFPVKQLPYAGPRRDPTPFPPLTECNDFINAAEHFVKGKRQNQLSEEHIAKIIDTYQFRKEEDRYSKRISMERIAEEGYNLNISRYISTSIAESEIDLEATHAELVEIENAIQEATTKHNAFLKELGLPPLPSTGSNSSRD